MYLKRWVIKLEDDDYQAKEPKGSRKYYIVLSLLLIITLCFAYQILMWSIDGHKTKQTLNEVKKEVAPIVTIEKEDNKEDPKTTTPAFPFLQVDFTDLKKRNPEVVAWLKIDVGVDMPIVQHTDNEFYLKHDLDKRPNVGGWVFADCQSDTEALGFNTVFYGHDMINGTMFGNLKQLLQPEVQSKKDAEVIQLTTPSQQMIFQICSVYVTDYKDSQYLKQLFSSPSEKADFVNRTQNRNTVPQFARKDLSSVDKFLTLSTCFGAAGTTKRLVVVARLIAQK